MDEALQKAVLAKVQQTPIGQQIVQYLLARKSLPQFKETYTGDRGSFDYNTWAGNELPPQGRVSLRGGAEADASTMLHELTHAADRQLAEQYFEIPRGQRNSQFAQGFEKLSLNSTEKGRSARNMVAQALAGNWAKERQEYRASSPELAAFGVGNSAAPPGVNRGPLHVDPTMATEMAILLELASRKK